ncbi:MAG: chorismate synthase, partial [Lentisphaerae bacterium]|nr:chorismate synthase [Lentisphaerota bacterium]
MGSSLGRVFVVSTFGESHGRSVGAVIDGCPSRLPLTEADIQPQLDRRRPGQSRLTTPRDEKDTVQIMAGVEKGLTLGSPLMLLIANRDQRTADYEEVADIPRPSQADFTYHAKYGIRSAGGGGRASARETAGRVAAGAVAEKLLLSRHRVEIVAWVSSVGPIDCADTDLEAVDRAMVDQSELRCPDPDSAREMTALIEAAADEGDSMGGVITCVCRNVPAGWGEPVFEKAEALLAKAMLSIPAVKGFEIGSGFAGTRMKGSEHNDVFIQKGDRIGTATNRSGGIQAGITNGEPIVMRVAFKPVATIRSPQNTVDFDGKPVVLEITRGRHDPCVLPRAVPIVEAMAALVLAP